MLKTVNKKSPAPQIGSSFFPDSWSRTTVVATIRSAALIGTKGANGKFDVPLSQIRKGYKGPVRIRGFVSNGRIVQAFPDW